METIVKKKLGRPVGSKNKPKVKTETGVKTGLYNVAILHNRSVLIEGRNYGMAFAFINKIEYHAQIANPMEQHHPKLFKLENNRYIRTQLGLDLGVLPPSDSYSLTCGLENKIVDFLNFWKSEGYTLVYDEPTMNEEIFKELNLRFSQELFKRCAAEGIPMVYASSAATYGAGEFGYEDDEQKLDLLNPLNPYGRSKNDFDKWIFTQEQKPYFWAGLKFFNVYGPNEYHKARMASVVYHAYHQIKNTGAVNLFQSHREDYAHGAQMRDFIYVKDLCEVCLFLMHHRKNSGLYNLGSGQARTWNDLAQAIFAALQLPVQINYIPIPEDIREAYQYFTEATMHKMRQIGYEKPFTSIEEGIADYVNNYLEPAAWR
jgi:ADP-L-glycero-D-manno-heptose 6-epimerase